MHVKVSSDGKIWVDGKLAGSVDRPKVKVLLVHESPWSSIVKDSFTFATVAGLVAVGVAMDSVVLQIIGGGMGAFRGSGHDRQKPQVEGRDRVLHLRRSPRSSGSHWSATMREATVNGPVSSPKPMNPGSTVFREPNRNIVVIRGGAWQRANISGNAEAWRKWSVENKR